ncbi:MAG: competence/damage-inducible protein A [Deltaproteobacteria bacterium]|nr:MAG: competence/damage-inducible protein A [Deltaproteobacteria bacterium]
MVCSRCPGTAVRAAYRHHHRETAKKEEKLPVLISPISLPVCEIITIGSELLLGQIQDTNSTFLAAELAKIGVDVRFRTSVGDSFEDMLMALRTALDRSNLVITTGGLGPTEDDLTREAVAKVSGVRLVFKKDLMDQIEEIFSRYGYRMPDSNKKQAYIPEGAQAIDNPVGTAPGFVKEVDGKPVICLPGVPRELKYLWNNKVAEWIRNRFALEKSIVTYRVLKAAGIGESKVDTLIGDIIRKYQNPNIGLLASPGEIKIRITAEARDEGDALRLIEPVEQEIRARLGNKIFGADQETLEGVVNRLLRDRGLSATVLETFTCGKIAERLLVAGESAVRESVVFREYTDLARRFPGVENPPSIDQVTSVAQSLATWYERGVGLAVVGFVRKQGDGCLLDGLVAAAGEGVEKTYSWTMGGDPAMLRQRGTVIGLNTLRLGLISPE